MEIGMEIVILKVNNKEIPAVAGMILKFTYDGRLITRRVGRTTTGR